VFCSSDGPSVLTDLSTLVGSYDKSTLAIAYFHQPELKFLPEAGSGSECAMNVANYDERNLEVGRFLRHDNQVWCLDIV